MVVGVHTPEFEFEKNLENVRRAVQELRVAYPGRDRQRLRVWRAFDNNAWPALYFVDAQGRVRHHHLGEGDYERSERMIQQLLAEAGAAGVAARPGLGRGPRRRGRRRLGQPEVAGNLSRLRARARTAVQRRPRAPAAQSVDGFGRVDGEEQAIVLNKPNGRIAYRFHARDLHLVMGPAAPASAVRFRVLIDGKPPGAAHGGDVDEQGNGTVTEQRMYQLIRQPEPIADRTFEIEFLDPAVEAYAFTFG